MPAMARRLSLSVARRDDNLASSRQTVAMRTAQDAEIDAMRASFATLHGQRLHGFALLLVLGDELRARELAAASVTAGMGNVLALRHPERAAAWLRADVLRRARRSRPAASHGGEALQRLNASGAALDALAALDMTSRAVVIAADVERLEMRDVNTIVARSPSSGARLLSNARRRYVAAFRGPAVADGPLARRIAGIAATVGRFGPAR